MNVPAALPATLAGLLAAFITYGPASADPCPVTITTLNLIAHGSTRHFVEYQADLSTAEPGGYSFEILVIDGSPRGPGKVSASKIDFKKVGDQVTASIRFVWPTELSFVAINEAGRENSPAIHCSQIPNVPSSGALSADLFDDTAMAPKRIAQATSFVNAAITRRVMPIYPVSDVRNGHEGVVVIRITIGADGKVLDARVQTKSQYEGLNQAALDAAKASSFSPALENGIPIATESIVEYRFLIPPGFKA